MELIKNGRSAITPLIVANSCLGTSLSLNLFLFSYLVGHLFKGSSLGVKSCLSCPFRFLRRFLLPYIILMEVVIVKRGRKSFNTTIKERSKIVYKHRSKVMYKNKTYLLMNHSKSTLETASKIGNDSSSVLDQPTYLRKGVRTCTQHPISNFVSCHALSPSFRSFFYYPILYFFSLQCIWGCSTHKMEERYGRRNANVRKKYNVGIGWPS